MYLMADTQPVFTPGDCTVQPCVSFQISLPTAPLLPLFTQISIRCCFMTKDCDCFQNQGSKSVGSKQPPRNLPKLKTV